jgi:hypothetical protein
LIILHLLQIFHKIVDMRQKKALLCWHRLE